MNISRITKKVKTALRLFKDRRVMDGLYVKATRYIRDRKLRTVRLALKNGRILHKRIIGGGKMMLWPDDEVSTAIYINEYEVSEALFVSKVLKPGMVFVDVGANIGLYSVMASKLVGEHGMVYSIEPAGEIFSKLLSNIEYNNLGNVMPLKMAISDNDGLATIKVLGEGCAAWSSLGNTLEGKCVAYEDVSTMSLDSFARSYNLVNKINLIKIDVEGWESKVLAGSSMIMNSTTAPLMMVEFTEENANRNGSSCIELYRMLSKYGFDLYKYDMNKNSLIMLDENENFAYLNAICVRKDGPKPSLL